MTGIRNGMDFPSMQDTGASRRETHSSVNTRLTRYFDEHDTETIFNRILALTQGGGDTTVRITSRWAGNLRWARNWITTSGDTRDHLVTITRTIRGASGVCQTNKIDDTSLTLAIETAERIVQYHSEWPNAWPSPGKLQYLEPKIWSNTTYSLDAAQRSSQARALIQEIQSGPLKTAGYLEVAVLAQSVRNTRGLSAYYASTQAEYSVTIRNSEGTGSGWAGIKHYDWTAIDARKITETAHEKCIRSADPKAIEPGRYTAILEPQAVYDLFYGAVAFMDRASAERNVTAYTLSFGQSKIGLKIFDERINIRTSPLFPGSGYIPFDGNGYPYRPVSWVENGVLKELSYDQKYAVDELRSNTPLPNPYAFAVDGEDTSIDEMIATTKRGLLVTRFNQARVLDKESLLMTGYTRDGVWLIENGVLKYPVKNFRFLDSPMFIFNRIVQMSPAVPVFATPNAVVPAMKVDDFNFASLTDAV